MVFLGSGLRGKWENTKVLPRNSMGLRPLWRPRSGEKAHAHHPITNIIHISGGGAGNPRTGFLRTGNLRMSVVPKGYLAIRGAQETGQASPRSASCHQIGWLPASTTRSLQVVMTSVLRGALAVRAYFPAQAGAPGHHPQT